MSPLLVSMCLIAACGAAHAAEPSETGIDEEGCVFDQDEQKEAYLALEKKYPGSRYVENQYKLIIPRSGDQITLRRGGCVHFGVSIEFRTSRTEEYEDDDEFFSKVMTLVDEYGQGFIDRRTWRNRYKTKTGTTQVKGETLITSCRTLAFPRSRFIAGTIRKTRSSALVSTTNGARQGLPP